MNFLSAVICLVSITGINSRGSPPKITEPSDNKWTPENFKYVRVTESISVPCSAKASPEAKYYWTFNGERIKSDPHIIAFDENTGTLTAGAGFSTSNVGDYQCYAYNKHGTSMTPILKLVLAFQTAFEKDLPPSSVGVSVSQYAKLECKYVQPSVPWWEFSWKRGTSKFASDPNEFISFDLGERMLIDEDGSLHFLWTEKSDEYNYGCVVKNIEYVSSYGSTSITTLTVNDANAYNRGPELKFSSKDVVVYAGKEAHMHCIFSYYSVLREKLKIQWLHGGSPVEGANGPNLTLSKVPLPDSQQNASGEYRCEASLGTKTAHGVVILKIVSPPTFIKHQELLTKSVPVEKDAVFECGTASYRTYSFPTVWLVNGKPLLGCPEYYFECKQTLTDGFSQCISEKFVCDGVEHCTDGSDELNCPGSCDESQTRCRGECVSKTTKCEELKCDYPNFLCRDKYMCIPTEKLCDDIADCRDGSDEVVCADREDIKRGRFYINSQRSQLTLPSVSLNDGMCFQCMARNEYGTTIGDACFSVIDKILIRSGPNSTYYVEPGSSIEIIVEATTDIDWQQQMNYTWERYVEQIDEETGESYIVRQTLPPPGKFWLNYFVLTMNNRRLQMLFPEVKEGEEGEDNKLEIYNELINRNYTLIVQHRFDRVEVNFTVNGKQILPPPGPIVETASTNLWFIALILGILLLFIVVALIICYMYRNRGGTYPLDKKEHQAGHDPEQELKDTGLQDVGIIGDDDTPQGDKASLTDSVKPYESDDDPTTEYGGDLDMSKFNEEGSFIGVYGAKTKEATV